MLYKYSLSLAGFDFRSRKKKETKKKNEIIKTWTYYRLIQAKIGTNCRIISAEIHQKSHILSKSRDNVHLNTLMYINIHGLGNDRLICYSRCGSTNDNYSDAL